MLVAAQASEDQVACAQLHMLLGRVLLEGGHLRQAEAELRSGLELFLRLLGVGHISTARSGTSGTLQSCCCHCIILTHQ